MAVRMARNVVLRSEGERSYQLTGDYQAVAPPRRDLISSCNLRSISRSSLETGGGAAVSMAVTTAFGASACFTWISADQTSKVRKGDSLQ
jgi:hypothetical protein